MACHDVENMSKRELKEAVQEKKQSEELVPIVRVSRKTRKIQPQTVQPAAETYAESAKYDEQFALHRNNMLSAYNELLKILVAQSRVDTARKEVNRKKALEIAIEKINLNEDLSSTDLEKLEENRVYISSQDEDYGFAIKFKLQDTIIDDIIVFG